jgi:hypothetical protein
MLASLIDSLKKDAKTLILLLLFDAESHSGLVGGGTHLVVMKDNWGKISKVEESR